MARAMPVLPEVGSISTSPGLMSPRFSAWRIIEIAGRSFTEPAGLSPSSFARTTFLFHNLDSASKALQPDQRRVADEILDGALHRACSSLT